VFFSTWPPSRPELSEQILSRIKVMWSSTLRGGAGLPQDGSFKITFDGRAIDFAFPHPSILAKTRSAHTSIKKR